MHAGSFLQGDPTRAAEVSLKKNEVKHILKVEKVELADAHCHLDALKVPGIIYDAIRYGVMTMVTNGINVTTSKRCIQISDARNIFAAVGIDPDSAMRLGDGTVGSWIKTIRDMAAANPGRVVAIGEIGLDHAKAKIPEFIARQKEVFDGMLDVALELNLPVSVHSRETMDDVMDMLKEKGAKKVHLHFFEGDIGHAREAAGRGYMISVPPIDSSRRRAIIKDFPIDNLMAESDSPAVGESPKAVETPVRMIAEVKGLTFPRTAEILTANTKRFFGIKGRGGFMRS